MRIEVRLKWRLDLVVDLQGRLLVVLATFLKPQSLTSVADHVPKIGAIIVAFLKTPEIIVVSQNGKVPRYFPLTSLTNITY